MIFLHFNSKKLEEKVAIVCEENGQLQFQLEQQKKVTEDMSRLHTAKGELDNCDIKQPNTSFSCLSSHSGPA